MRFSDDTAELLFLLSKYNVRYLIVGDEAAIFYGVARFTGDIDIFYDISEDNSQKLFSAIKEFWDNNIPGIKSKDEFTSSQIVQFGLPPNRVDLMNEIDGVSFNECWVNREKTEYQNKNKTFNVFYIGLNDLIKNKEVSSRNKDLDDLEYLKKLISNTQVNQ